MTVLRGISAVIAMLAFAFTAFAQAPARVRTQSGLVQGTVQDGIAVYKGIPFAAPPMGDLRWRAPQPPAAWTGVRAADKFAPGCSQNVLVMPALGIEGFPVSEDCLYLNVWTPAKSPSARLPVMIWIYGGGFSIGGTAIGTYDGMKLAKKGVLLVSIAYRVGPFGFLADSELSAENGGHSGNYGLLDQIAGLKWVQRNIAAFGGDPRRVTIFGESAGGISVSMLAASPLARGLFQRAISESGGSFGPARTANEGGTTVPSLRVAEKHGADLFSKLGVSSVADARKVSAEAILKSQPPGLGGGFWPNFDGYVLPGDQYDLYEAGRYNDTPILIGTNADEGALFVPSIKAPDYVSGTHAAYGDYADKILAAYPSGADAEALRSARDLARDSTFGWHTWTWARLQAKTGKGKVFLYYFTHRPPYPDTPQFRSYGASHGAEIAYVFGNFAAAMPAAAQDTALSDMIMSYWTNFARAGDPNGKGLAEWPAFTTERPVAMYLDNPAKAGPVPNLDKLLALDGYYAWRRQSEAKR